MLPLLLQLNFALILVLPKQTWSPLDPEAVVSGTKTLAADALSPISHDVEPPWIGLCLSIPSHRWSIGFRSGESGVDIWSRQTRCWAPHIITAPFDLVAGGIILMEAAAIGENHLHESSVQTGGTDYNHKDGPRVSQQNTDPWDSRPCLKDI